MTARYREGSFFGKWFWYLRIGMTVLFGT